MRWILLIRICLKNGGYPHPLTGVTVTAGNTTADQNIGFDELNGAAIYTPPVYEVCKSTKVEQLDAFQYATATGAGAAGIPSLNYTAPAGSNRFMLVVLSMERDHAPFDGRGDNFETNPGVTFPTVSFGGANLQRLAYSVDSAGSSYSFPDAEISRSHYIYGLFDLSIPAGQQTLTVSNINAPASAGDDAILAVATFANVGGFYPSPSGGIIDRTAPFNASLTTSPVSTDQPPGTTPADNLLLAFGTSSKPESLTIGAGWSKLAEILLANPNGAYATAAGRASGPFTENDGHTLLIQAIQGVTTDQTARISSASANLQSLSMHAYQMLAHGCDYGDALASYGDAFHSQSWSRRIGAQRGDAETATPLTVNASGDDSNKLDDEDGVTIPALSAGQAATINVTIAGSGYLNSWIDWNGDGDFADAGEQVATDLQDSNADGIIPVTVNVPANATVSPTYARFRWSIGTGAGPAGWASYGEVEDYAVTINATVGACASPSNEQIYLSHYNYTSPDQAIDDDVLRLNFDAASRSFSNEVNLGGDVNTGWADIAYAPDGTLYGIWSNNGYGGVYRINKTTAGWTYLGDVDASGNFYELLADENGLLYTVAESGSDQVVYRFDPKAAAPFAVTTVINLGSTLVGEGDLAWSNGLLYWTATTDQGVDPSQLISIDIAKGEVKTIAILKNDGTPLLNADSLFNDSLGHLYFASGNNVYEVNPVTGITTLSYSLSNAADGIGGATSNYDYCQSSAKTYDFGDAPDAAVGTAAVITRPVSLTTVRYTSSAPLLWAVALLLIRGPLPMVPIAPERQRMILMMA
ncbi:MAG: GEVED domain-containing protein [Thiolinea sp.]